MILREVRLIGIKNAVIHTIFIEIYTLNTLKKNYYITSNFIYFSLPSTTLDESHVKYPAKTIYSTQTPERFENLSIRNVRLEK